MVLTFVTQLHLNVMILGSLMPAPADVGINPDDKG